MAGGHALPWPGCGSPLCCRATTVACLSHLPMARLVLAHGQPARRLQLAEHLERAGHQLHCATDYPDLRVALLRFAPAVLLLDEALPQVDSLALLAELRQQQPLLGLVLLGASAQLAERLVAWRLGADHVLPAEVAVDELVLVVRNLARRIQPATQAQWALDLPRLTLNAPDGRAVPLTASELAVLQAIARATHQRCDRAALAGALGEDWRTFDERRLEALMSRLRRKLHQQLGSATPLRTLRGQGYGFVEPLTLR